MVAPAALLVGLVVLPTQATADEPQFPRGASATRASGLGFDTCTAPSLSSMQAWRSSPYDSVNVYFGGKNRGCQQPNLTPSWIRSVDAMGFGILPTYLSAQPSCIFGYKQVQFTKSTAKAKAASDAADAIKRARRLGLLPGSALYADIEHFDPGKSSCRSGVQRYLSVWTQRLHAQGYLAGAYLHLYSGAPAARDTFSAKRFDRLDAVWVARWDGRPSLTGWDGLPNRMWSNGQRIKQYRGDHVEKHGGTSINIDSNVLHAPVATVASSYRSTAESRLGVRRWPTTQSSQQRSIRPGRSLQVLCQAFGEPVDGDRVWNKLAGGGYVADRYVSTPAAKGRSPGLPRCELGYQATTTGGLLVRSAPWSEAKVVDSLPEGAMAWVQCQAPDQELGGKVVWDKVGPRRWVVDAEVSTTAVRFTRALPRCG